MFCVLLILIIQHLISCSNELDPQTIELGIVSINNDNRIAIAPNSLLLGIAVGLLKLSALDKQAIENQFRNIDLNPLLSVTLADKLAISSFSNIQNIQNEQLFGANGEWNSSYCQTQYKLTTKGLSVSLAELNGAIDGYTIGTKLLSDSGEHLHRIRLSTLIRSYYSPSGLSADCGLCFLNYLTELQGDNRIAEVAKNYVNFWNTAFNYDNLSSQKLMAYVDMNLVQYNQYIVQAKNVKYTGKCIRLVRNSAIITIAPSRMYQSQ